MNAHDILEAAAGHMKDRAATYDKPEGERSMGATVVAFNAITGAELTEEQGWLFMGLLKMVRTQQGAYRADNYEDGAAYFALQGEAAQAARARFDIDTGSELTDTIAKHGLGHEAVSEAVSNVNDDGWIDWMGGENPAGNAWVQVRFRNGETEQANAGGLIWSDDVGDDEYIIIAYRILEE